VFQLPLDARFTEKASPNVAVGFLVLAKPFYGDVSVNPVIPDEDDFAHATFAKGRTKLVTLGGKGEFPGLRGRRDGDATRAAFRKAG
jgi:hypothetical protein